MPLEVKICGLSSDEAVSAALEGGADLLGFNFYAPSPRAVAIEQAASLSRLVSRRALKVGLFVDADDDFIGDCIEAADLDMLQFHGAETRDRVTKAKERFGLPVMKVIKISGRDDLEVAHQFSSVADRLLFDTKPPPDLPGMLPGGNALAFDWHLLSESEWPLPWLLAGGLDARNIGRAVAISGAPGVDVSSGVETSPGHKDPHLIREFLRAAKSM